MGAASMISRGSLDAEMKFKWLLDAEMKFKWLLKSELQPWQACDDDDEALH